MNKTSYEKEGLNSLNELFEKLIVCSEKQDKEGTLRIVSSLNDEEKDYLYTWATEQGKLDKVAGIVVKAEMDKKAFDINCRFKKTLCEALVQNGYCLEGDPDVYNSDSFPFTDNKYINGEVIFDTRKVQLKARDAENRKYEKTIDYSSVGDLMESINHFRKDIEETFEKPEVVEEVVKEEPFDILGDKNFLKEIGADWVTDLIKKKAETVGYKEYYNDADIVNGLYDLLKDNVNINYGWDTISTYYKKDIDFIGFLDYIGDSEERLKMYYEEEKDFLNKFFVHLDSLDKFLTAIHPYLENARSERLNEEFEKEQFEEEQPQGDKSASIKGGLGKKAAEGNSAEGEVHIQEISPGKNKEYIRRYKSLDPCAKHIIDVFHTISEDVINRSDNSLKEILNPKAEFEISDDAVFEFDFYGLQRIPEHNAYVIVYISSLSKDILNSEEENYLEDLHNDITEEFTNWLQKYLDASPSPEKPNKELINTVIDSYDDFYKAIKENLGYELLHNHIITREDGGFFDMAAKNAVQTGKGDILRAEGIISYEELRNFLNKIHNI